MSETATKTFEAKITKLGDEHNQSSQIGRSWNDNGVR